MKYKTFCMKYESKEHLFCAQQYQKNRMKALHHKSVRKLLHYGNHAGDISRPPRPVRRQLVIIIPK